MCYLRRFNQNIGQVIRKTRYRLGLFFGGLGLRLKLEYFQRLQHSGFQVTGIGEVQTIHSGSQNLVIGFCTRVS
jgi:hypothetical protein